MLVEILLDVEVSEGISIRNTKETLKVSIRLDLVFILETILLHISRYSRSYLSAAHLAASGLAKELAEIGRNILRLLEHIRTLRLSRVDFTLGTLALTSFLDLLRDTLVKLAETSNHLGGLVTETSNSLKSRADVIIDSGGRGSISSTGAYRRSLDKGTRLSSNSSNRGSGLSGLGLGGTGLLLSSRGGRSGSSYNRGSSGSRGSLSLLYSTGLLGGFSIAHCVITGGIIIHLLTH
jgi:hypothetical protein